MKAASITIKKNKTYLGPQSLLSIDFLPFSFFLSKNSGITFSNPIATNNDPEMALSICLLPVHQVVSLPRNLSSGILIDGCTIMGQSEQQEKVWRNQS